MQYNINELNIDEIDSVNGGAITYTGEGIAAGIGTLVGGLGGTYFGVAAFALGPGFAAGAIGAFAIGSIGYSVYVGASLALDAIFD